MKFARADWSRNFGSFSSRDEAIAFLDTREFFFGDPFVVKYTEDGETKLMLAIGKSVNPTITSDTTEVTGGVGEYELFDMNEFRDAIEELIETTSGLTEDVQALYELIGDLTGSTSQLEEIIGSGWTDSPTNVTLTDRIKKDEELMKIVWEYNHGDSGLYEPRFNDVPLQLVYDEIHNKLALVAGDVTGATVQLVGATVFTRVEYDAEHEVLKLWYHPGGNPDVPEECVEIPVGDLINEWEPYNEGHTVTLTRERIIDGTDRLSADLNISNDPDNIIEIDDDGDVKVSNIPILTAIGGVNARCQSIQDQLDDEKGYRKAIKLVQINPNDFAQLGLGDDVRDAYFVSYHAQGSTEPVALPDPSRDAIIKVYKDSVIYKIYFGHVDDQLTSPTDPTVIDGTGATAVCFIYFDANGHYALATNEFDLGDAFDELVEAFNESEEVTALALNRLAEAIVELSGNTVDGFQMMFNIVQDMGQDLEDLGNAFNESEEVTAIALNRLAEGVVQNANQIQENAEHIEDVDERVGAGFFGGGFRVDITDRIKDIENNIIGRHYPGAPFDNTYVMVGDHRELRPILPYANGTNIEGQINGLNQALVGISGTTSELSDLVEDIRRIDDSFELALDTDMAVISFNWTDENGNPRSSSINVSDFTKDSFLQDVEVVRVDGVEYLKFTWITYDPEHGNPPLEILVPLSDFATIYHAGAGIDPNELEDNQIITVKIDPMHEGENSWLAKEPNGLRVTGITEYVDEQVDRMTQYVDEQVSAMTQYVDGQISAMTEYVDNQVTALTEYVDTQVSAMTESLEDYVRKDEVEDHLDSASTLPVQNAVVTNALNDLEDAIEDIMSSLSAFTADTIAVNDLTAITANIENLTANTIVTNEITGDTAVFNHITAETIVTDSITGDTGYFSGLTANTFYADEYQNLPTATTEQYGVVILDDHLDSGSTNPVMNSAITMVILEDEETVAAALNDLNDRKADRSELNDAINQINEEIQEIWSSGLTDVVVVGSGNVVTNIERDGNNVKATMGSIIVDDHLDTGSTNPVENRVITQVILDDEETVAAALNDLNDRKADRSELNDAVDNINNQLTAITASGMTVEMFNNYTASTATAFTSQHITAQTINATGLTATTANIDNITAQTVYTTGLTANTGNIDNITAQTILTNSITGNTANFTGLTATTVSATTYNNLPTATTTQYGVVIMDDHLDSGSTNPVQNSAVTHVILENEEVVAAALNDLNDRKADRSELNNAISTLEGDMLTGATTTGASGANVVTGLTVNGQDVVGQMGRFYTTDEVDALVAGGTAVTENFVTKLVFTAYTGNTQTYVDTNFVHSAQYVSTGTTHVIVFKDASGNTLSTINADDFIKDGMVNDVLISGSSLVVTFNTDAGHQDIVIPLSDIFNPNNYYTKTDINGYTANTLNGVTTAGTGNVVTSVEKDGDKVKVTYGNVDVSSKLDTTAFTAYSASTLNGVTTAGTGTIVTNVEKDGDQVKVTKTNEISLSGLTANTISATTYNNLPTASTTTYGVVKVDDALNSGSTNPVQNGVITRVIIENELVTAAALNDLNNRKANIEDVPVSVNDLDGAGDLALKTDLAGYLPLSGGTMTGNISGSTGNAIYMPGGFFQQSDETLKIFMGDIENALDKANKIPTKYFYWLNMPDGPRQLGTSAQKVQELFPEIVSGEDKLSVDYSKLAIVALAAVKELTAKVEDLQKQLDELKK